MATGEPCPFCGLTRAVAHAVHGDFHLAWASNPLWFLAAAVIAIFGITLIIDGLAGTDGFGRASRTLQRCWLPIVLGLIVFGIWRAIQ